MTAPKDNSFFVALEVARALGAEREELQQGLENDPDRANILPKVYQSGIELERMREKLVLMKDDINDALLIVNKDVNAFKPSEDTVNNNLNMDKIELPAASSSLGSQN